MGDVKVSINFRCIADDLLFIPPIPPIRHLYYLIIIVLRYSIFLLLFFFNRVAFLDLGPVELIDLAAVLN